MKLVFGGAHQGKRDFAVENLEVKEQDILDVEELCKQIDIKNDRDMFHSLEESMNTTGKSAPCVYGLEAFIRLGVYSGRNVDSWLEKWLDETGPRVIIMRDVSQGLVPSSPEEREFREANGRALIKIADRAEEVYRVFAGIGQRIK